MSYRWKNYETPEYVDQAQRMQGFVPSNVGQPPLTGPTELDVVNGGSYFGGDRGGDMARQQQMAMQSEQMNIEAQRRDEIQTQIDGLKQQLAEIDAQIARIDKEMPQMSGIEWDVAAKRAEIGDNAAYDNLMSRRNTELDEARTSARNSVKDLQTARGLVWGLESKDSDNQNIALNKINLALENAEREAARTGKALPEDYYKLREERDAVIAKTKSNADGIVNGEQWENKVYSAIKDKTYDEAMEKEALDFVRANPNDPRSASLRKIIEDNKGKTREAIARGKTYKAGSDALYKQAKDMSKKDLEKWWKGLTKSEQKQFNKYHKIDLVKGTVQ